MWFRVSDPGGPGAPRASSLQDLWHHTLARIVDACAATAIQPFYGPFGDIADLAGCEAQFRSAFVMGAVDLVVCRERASLLKRVALVNTIWLATMTAVSLRYFFVIPISFFVVALLIFAVAWWKLPGSAM